MARTMSRPARWAEACEIARTALAEIESAKGTLEEAFGTLRDLRSEYDDWRSNLPEMAQGTAVEEKLDAVCDLDLEPNLDIDTDDIESALENAEGADLPLGFGRD